VRASTPAGQAPAYHSSEEQSVGSFTSYADQQKKPKDSWRWSLAIILIFIMAAASFGLGLAAHMRVGQGSRLLEAGSNLSAYHSDGNMVDVATRSDEDIRPLQTMIEALRQVRRFFVEPIEESQESQLTYSSIGKMVESLNDPQSRFLLPEQRQLAEDALQGKFHGIGAVLGIRKEKTANGIEARLVVVAAMPGSPAAEAGLLPGDSIREKDGKWVISYNPIDSAMEMLKGVRNGQINPADLQKAFQSAKKKLENGVTIQKAADELTKSDKGKFSLVVVRKSTAKAMRLDVVPRITEVASIEHKMLDDSTGYIKVNYFGQSTPQAFAEALGDLGRNKATRLVLDLRSAPGGSSDAALKVAGLIEPKKPFALLAKAHNMRDSITAPDSEKKSDADSKAMEESSNLRKPMVALVNGGTSNAAEALAASLHDNGLAVLVGSPTYGDLLQHTMFVLRDGSAVTFTTGKFLTPKGMDLNEKGLPVDIAVAYSTTGDAQLDKARATVKAKTGI
jgi:carboxyl-terminal processing protease